MRWLTPAFTAPQAGIHRNAWLHGYNRQRQLGPIGHIPSVEAEAAYYRQQAGQAKAA